MGSRLVVASALFDAVPAHAQRGTTATPPVLVCRLEVSKETTQVSLLSQKNGDTFVLERSW